MILTRRARELVTVAALLSLPVVSLRSTVRAPEELGMLDRTVLRASAPLEAGMAFGLRGLGGVWSRYLALVHVSDENRRLREENARLKADLERAQAEAAGRAEL